MMFQNKIHETFMICIILFLIFPINHLVSQNLESTKRTKVFILAGQANMEGRADGKKLVPQDHDRLLQAQKNVKMAFNNEPVGQLKPVKPSPEIAEIS